MELTLERGVEQLPGVGAARAAHLERLGLRTVGDLLRCFPRAYEDRRRMANLSSAPPDLPVCSCAMAAEAPRLTLIRKGLELVKLRVVDDSGAAWITFFNQSYKIGRAHV